MMNRMWTAGLLLCLPGTLNAQTLSEVCSAVGQLDSGSYVTYEIDGAGPTGQQISEMRFALVGQTTGGSAAGFWYEFRAVAEEAIIIQMLVPGFPFDPADIQSMVLKAGNQPAMKIPSQMLGMVRSQMDQNELADFGKHCAESEVLGTETVSVPAGRFSSLHIRTKQGAGEAWISRDIPFGMVKARTDAGDEMVATGYGYDAVSSIRETPVELPLPGLSGAGAAN
ncbi:MAG: hypothetical protein ABFS14_09610 [Gemmatimonadota bacterium]